DRLPRALPAQPRGRHHSDRGRPPAVRRGAAAEAVRRGERRPRLRLREGSAVLPGHSRVPAGAAAAPATATPDPHEPLRDDVSMLGEMLGQTVRAREGDAVFEIVERVRLLAKEARGGGIHDVDALRERLRALPLETAVPVARAFSHFLT